ncbi:MAG: 3-hydroxybutyrate dehydrogenase [Bacteriovoracaceae bacterium]|nr:3-hydroxybutyrate dehydrogenase [Bacteriovoracaceae bacterium]
MTKVAIVTGGSSGIGLSIVKDLQAQGLKAVSWDIKAPSENVPFIECDVTSETKVQAALAQTIELYGAPSILINNCGLQFMAPVDEFPLEKWNQLIGIMLTGTFLCSKFVIPSMKKNGWGRIINVSSIHGKVASPYKAAYVSAKHGVLGLSKVMALELAEYNITVNSICPGFVDTPLMRQQITKQAELNQMSEAKVASEIMLKPACIKKFTTTEQVADLVKFFVSDSASTITGEAFNMSGGWGMGH